MSSEEDQKPATGPENAPSGHIYVCQDALPDPTGPPYEFIQRVTLLAYEIDTLSQQLWGVLAANAPVLLRSDAAVFVVGIGYLARGIERTGREMLARLGLPALDPLEDQKRLVRQQLAKPDCPADLAEHLTAVLEWLEGLEPTKPVESTEWPVEGFTIGGG